MPRQRLPITFGQGLDRATGAGARDARSLYNGRDVVAREAGLELRAGLQGSGLIALDWGTDVVAQASVEATLDILQVVYDRTSRDLRIYRVNPVSPSTRQNVGTWGTLHANALFPIITMAEAGGKVLFAHAEPTLAHRLVSKYWTPGALDTDAGTLANASGDLDGDGTPADIKFFGVARYREYLIGWGWGTETSAATQDRVEIVRHTKPDDVSVWRPGDYFICGPKTSRILACGAVSNGLVCASLYEAYTVTGTDPQTWGVQISDPSHGVVSPRAMATINGVLYRWAPSGPRVTRDATSPSEDLALTLDLNEAVPDDWPARGPSREVFTAYDADQRALYFVHPDLTSGSATTTFAVILSLRLTQALRFTVARLLRRVACAGRYLAGKITPPPGVAYASATAAVDDGWFSSPLGRRLTISWTNNSALGNETVEVWLKTGSTWAVQATVALSGTSQSTTIAPLEALTDYEVAIRMRTPAGAYTTGFSEATPNLWSSGSAAGAKDTITTGGAAPSVLTVSTWTRLSSTQTVFNITVGAVDKRTSIELERQVGAGAFSVVYTESPTSGVISYQYEVQPGEVGQNITFRARLKRGANVSSYNTAAAKLAGVNYVIGSLDVFDATESEGETATTLRGAAELPVGGDQNIIQWEEVGGASASLSLPLLTYATEPIYAWLPKLVSTINGTNTGSMTYRARLGRQLFGVTDWAAWTGNVTVTFTGAAAPTVPDNTYFVSPYGTLTDDNIFPLDFEVIMADFPRDAFQSNDWLLVVRDEGGADAPVVPRLYDYATYHLNGTVTLNKPTDFQTFANPKQMSIYEVTHPSSGLKILSPAMSVPI